ncbi:sulfotransferase family protein [Kaarinaea lacus]
MNHKLLLRRASKFLTPEGHIKRRMWQERGGTLDKMLIILPELKVVYTSIPKAANSTIKKCLWAASGVSIEGKNINSSIFKNPGPSRPVSAFDDGELEIIFHSDEWFRFSFVRNPYTRLLSAYKDKILGLGNTRKHNSFLKKIQWHSSQPPTFEQFITAITNQSDDAMDWHWMPQSRLIMADIIEYDFIGKLESYNEDMRTVLTRLNTSPDIIDETLSVSLNKTRSKDDIESPISQATAELIQHRFPDDFKNFGYDIESFRDIN